VRDAMPESMDDKVLSGKTRAVDANILATIPKSGTYREFGDCLCHKFVEMMSDNKDWEEDPDAGQSAQVWEKELKGKGAPDFLLYKSSVMVPIPPALAMHYLWLIIDTCEWDQDFLRGEVLSDFDSSDQIRTTSLTLIPGMDPRKFVYFVCHRVLENGTVVMPFISVEYDVDMDEDAQLGKYLLSGLSFEPAKEARASKTTYYSHLDPLGWVPNFVTNRMNKDRALMLDKFHKQILHEVKIEKQYAMQQSQPSASDSKKNGVDAEPTTELGKWLNSMGLKQYLQKFEEAGYDDLTVCADIGKVDLDEIGVTKPGHRKKLLLEASKLKGQ